MLLPARYRHVQLPLGADGEVLPELRTLATSRFVDSSGNRQYVPLTDDDPWAAGRIQIGLAPAALQVLRRHGYAARCVDFTDRQLPARAPGAVKRRGIRDGSWLRFVTGVACGLVRYERGEVDLAWLFAQAALEWPTARILIVVASRHNGEILRHCLCRYLPPSAVAFVDCDNAVMAARIMISTPRATLHAGLLHANFVFVPDAVEAVGTHFQDVLRQPTCARIFGMLCNGTQPSPYERDVISASFGFEVLRLFCHGQRSRPITRLEVSVSGPKIRGCRDSNEARKRIERHPVRFRLTLKIARSLVDGNIDCLRTYVPTDSWNAVAKGRIILLAASLKHALKLAAKLPAWRLVTGPDIDKSGLTPLQRLIAAECDVANLASGRPVIATVAGLQGARNLRRVSCIIRADTGSRVNMNLPHADVIGNKETLVVDFDDHNLHPISRCWSRLRRYAALDAGWRVIRPNGLEYTNVCQYLASRKGSGNDCE